MERVWSSGDRMAPGGLGWRLTLVTALCSDVISPADQVETLLCGGPNLPRKDQQGVLQCHQGRMDSVLFPSVVAAASPPDQQRLESERGSCPLCFCPAVTLEQFSLAVTRCPDAEDRAVLTKVGDQLKD